MPLKNLHITQGIYCKSVKNSWANYVKNPKFKVLIAKKKFRGYIANQRKIQGLIMPKTLSYSAIWLWIWKRKRGCLYVFHQTNLTENGKMDFPIYCISDQQKGEFSRNRVGFFFFLFSFPSSHYVHLFSALPLRVSL